MDDAFLLLFKLATAALALPSAVLVSRWLDARAGVKFGEKIKSCTAGQWLDYCKFRWLGICIVIAACFL